MSWQALDAIAFNLLAAGCAGGIVGLERSYNGRVAGLRTHALVALAGASAMTIAYAPALLPGAFPSGAPRLDPTRLAQGVMSGVGFLGAGVIFKEGVSVQGLTTAASIWATAAIGLLCGLGLAGPGYFAMALVLGVLTVLRWIEGAIPSKVYALAVLKFEAEAAPSQSTLLELLGDHSISLADASYKLAEGGRVFEIRGSVEAMRGGAFEALAKRLCTVEGLIEFELDRVSK